MIVLCKITFQLTVSFNADNFRTPSSELIDSLAVVISSILLLHHIKDKLRGVPSDLPGTFLPPDDVSLRVGVNLAQESDSVLAHSDRT